MRAARSDSERIVSSPRRTGSSSGVRDERRSAQDGGERVVELVRDARDRLAERRHLLGLQQLGVEIAGLVVELLALADVAHQRFDPHAAAVFAQAIGVRGHLHPDRIAVGAFQAKQIVGDGAVGGQPLDERRARLRIEKPVGVERPDRGLGHFIAVAENQLEVRIGGERLRRIAGQRADVNTFVHRLEQPRERGGAPGQRACGGWGVGV